MSGELPVHWSPAALRDLDGVLEYLTAHNPLAAERLVEEILEASDSLATLAHRGKPGRVPGTREMLTDRPYVLVYRVEEGQGVRLLRLWHAAIIR
ncbi:type II toxin-antitoxin system RelE/ParE family toxin [Roseococcus thiosulfatophilus]|uniref:type II toxin-antitoxin system RelE/ParE family toxin n=1 Tax=Roseococcus thiosulfatophilus TaxID=35813 RepID=UPI001A8E9C06|nr:type II toxin-antitoxin system RelE/ParE family toxin [Roseococcus thiosulfatophilus]